MTMSKQLQDLQGKTGFRLHSAPGAQLEIVRPIPTPEGEPQQFEFVKSCQTRQAAVQFMEGWIEARKYTEPQPDVLAGASD